MSALISNSELYCTLVGAVGVLFSLILAGQVKAAPAGNERMNEIAAAIKEGAIAYLNRQMKTVFIAAPTLPAISACGYRSLRTCARQRPPGKGSQPGFPWPLRVEQSRG